MYIGVGTLVLLLVVILIVMLRPAVAAPSLL